MHVNQNVPEKTYTFQELIDILKNDYTNCEEKFLMDTSSIRSNSNPTYEDYKKYYGNALNKTENKQEFYVSVS